MILRCSDLVNSDHFWPPDHQIWSSVAIWWQSGGLPVSDQASQSQIRPPSLRCGLPVSDCGLPVSDRGNLSQIVAICLRSWQSVSDPGTRRPQIIRSGPPDHQNPSHPPFPISAPVQKLVGNMNRPQIYNAARQKKETKMGRFYQENGAFTTKTVKLRKQNF